MDFIPVTLFVLQALVRERVGPYEVKFIKKDGSERIMTCSNDVPSNGGTLKYDPFEHGLKVVWSVEDQACRMITMDSLIHLQIDNVQYFTT